MIASFPVLPNLHAFFALAMMVIALFLFSRHQIKLEISSLAILILLALVFSLFPYVRDSSEFAAVGFFHGFGHEALVAVCALMIIGQGLVHTGALKPLGMMLNRAWKVAPFLSSFATLLICAVLSAFINNTPIVVLLLPVLLSVCIRANLSPSKILMPVGFATIVGGTSTTIGTSTNLLVVSVANDLGLQRIDMFDFFVPAAIAGGVAILYLWLIAPMLLPARKVELADSSPRIFQARLNIGDSSPAIGLTLAQTKALVSGEINFVRVRRGNTYLLPLPDVVLLAGDRLRVRDTATNLRNAAETLKAALYSDNVLVDENNPLKAENQTVAEIAVVHGSDLAGQNLRYTRFLDQHQLLVIALHRAGRDVWEAHEEIMDVTLEPGDVLLVQGDKDNIHKMKRNTDFMVLDASEDVPGTRKAPLVIITLLAVVAVSSFGLVPIAISSMAGVFLLLASRSINMDVAMRAINASVVLVVVASLAIGQALEITGASQYLAEVFLYFFRESSPTIVMSALMFMMGVMTNVVSNNAAAVIGTPIAISIAQQIGVPPESFVLAVLFGANLSFATPMSYNTNLLVMSAGNYTFNDFVRVGLPLTLIMWISYTIILSNMYF